jgi:3-isopropylmalate/(R)-2-methylmalate dehydratase small subunit
MVKKRMKIHGRVWKFGDNVDTDQIIPAEYLVYTQPEKLAEFLFAKVRPDFSPAEGDLIVAGKNFGCGSSREHAPRAILGAGISCVVAESFARIYFRNSINLGLPCIECRVDADEGDLLEVDLEGEIINHTKKRRFKFHPLPDFLQEMLEAGGLVEWVKKRK